MNPPLFAAILLIALGIRPLLLYIDRLAQQNEQRRKELINDGY